MLSVPDNDVLALYAAIRERRDHRWTLALAGITGIAAGLVSFAWHGITALIDVHAVFIGLALLGLNGLFRGLTLRAMQASERARRASAA